MKASNASSAAPLVSAIQIPCNAAGAARKGDVVRLLQSLPEEGDIAVRLSSRKGGTREGYFSLNGLKVVREKLAAACKWPQAIAKPGK
jgi:hypothetical protein